jgi:DNA-binding NtrC family response regulator
MIATARILVIDDEPDMLENCRRLLTADGHECHTLADPLRVREVLRDLRPHLLLLDLRMPQADGMTVLAAAMADDPTLPVIVITAHASIGSAVKAMREGAFDYLPKPFTADQLEIAVGRAMRYRGLALENEALRAQVGLDGNASIVGSSPEFIRVLEQARKVARTDANVLITGESGTGKEVLARYVHAESPRRARSFIPIDCAALPEGLLESELFGHERGAFTGAVSRTEGLLIEANRGTAFLDEIGEMSPALQSKLLRALEERTVRRVGHSEFVELDIRVIAATNADLEAGMEAGSFRADLFYRLNVVALRLPPLRERPGDVPLLLQNFLAKFAAQMHGNPPRLSPDVWEALERYPWPGNVREVRNLAHRLVALDEGGRITLADLPEKLRGASLPPPEMPTGVPWLERGNSRDDLPEYEVARGRAAQQFRCMYVRQLLTRHGGNVTRAARTAGVSRRTFHRWLAELGPRTREGIR